MKTKLTLTSYLKFAALISALFLMTSCGKSPEQIIDDAPEMPEDEIEAYIDSICVEQWKDGYTSPDIFLGFQFTTGQKEYISKLVDEGKLRSVEDKYYYDLKIGDETYETEVWFYDEGDTLMLINLEITNFDKPFKEVFEEVLKHFVRKYIIEGNETNVLAKTKNKDGLVYYELSNGLAPLVIYYTKDDKVCVDFCKIEPVID